MLRLTENKDDIIIREIPKFQWIAIIVSLLILLIFASLFLYNEVSVSISFFFGSILFVASFIIVVSPITTVKISRKSKLITVEKRSLIKNTFKIYPFREVADLIYVEEIKDSNGHIICKFIMPLKSGDIIELFNISSDTGKYFNAANFMNDIIFDSDFKLSAFNEIKS
ncbi:MAG: hypothetical protein ABIP06_15240 [Pyrinomonadaceae bacterium]